MSIIVALDVHHAADALALAEHLNPKQCRLKVGKELFTVAGPNIVRQLQQRDFEIFLDLKFHDIPNTTAQAVLAAADLGVWMVNVHASGGQKMLQTCVERLQQHAHRTLLTAVTVLTSMSDQDLHAIGINTTAAEQVQRLARLSAACGLDGVVCSAQEAKMLRQILPPDFQLVTPGIRPAGSASDDQQRIVTPLQAMQNGVNHLVIGRPITRAAHPQQALDEIWQSIQTI